MRAVDNLSFNFDKAIADIKSGKNISGKDGVLAPLVKQLVEVALQAELESHIAEDVLAGKKNRKNGRSSKTIKSSDRGFILNFRTIKQ